MLADTYTPVSIYLKLRDIYPDAILLESTDYKAADNSFSYLCFHPLAGIKLNKEILTLSKNRATTSVTQVNSPAQLFTLFDDFRLSFTEASGKNGMANGLFG